MLAGGLVALSAALGVAWVVADQAGWPGPGPGALGWHVGAAALAVLAQVQADRRRGWAGAAWSGAVLVITGAVLAARWLA